MLETFTSGNLCISPINNYSERYTVLLLSSDMRFNGTACSHQTQLIVVSGTQQAQKNSAEQKEGTREFGSILLGTEG